jgi:hypothetical protein
MKTSDIQIRDPFIFPNQDENLYYLFGTTDKDCWKGPGAGIHGSDQLIIRWESDETFLRARLILSYETVMVCYITIVNAEFFKMRHQPEIIDAVTRKPTADHVVQATFGHGL